MIVWEALQIAEERLEPKHKEVDADTHVILPFTIQFSSVQSLSCGQLFATPWTAACQASLTIILPSCIFLWDGFGHDLLYAVTNLHLWFFKDPV